MIDSKSVTRAVTVIGIVGHIDGHDVIRRASAIDVVKRYERDIEALRNALLKACGDDADMARDLVESQAGGNDDLHINQQAEPQRSGITAEQVAELKRLADEYAHVYSFVKSDEMPRARAALHAALDALKGEA